MDLVPSLSTNNGVIQFIQYLKWAEVVVEGPCKAREQANLLSEDETKARPKDDARYSQNRLHNNNNTSKKSTLPSRDSGGFERRGTPQSDVGRGGCTARGGCFTFGLPPSLRALCSTNDKDVLSAPRSRTIFDGLKVTAEDHRWVASVCDDLSDGIVLLYLALRLAQKSHVLAGGHEGLTYGSGGRTRRDPSWNGTAVSHSMAQWCIGTVEEGSRREFSVSRLQAASSDEARERVIRVLDALESEVLRLKERLMTKCNNAPNAGEMRSQLGTQSARSSTSATKIRSTQPSHVPKSPRPQRSTSKVASGKAKSVASVPSLASKIFSGNFEAILYTLHVLFLAYVAAERLDRVPPMLSWYAALASGGYGLDTMGLSVRAKCSHLIDSSGRLKADSEPLAISRVVSLFSDGTLWLLALDNLLRMKSLFERFELHEMGAHVSVSGSSQREKAVQADEGHSAAVSSSFIKSDCLDMSQVYLCPETIDEKLHNLNLWTSAMRKLGIYNYFDLAPAATSRANASLAALVPNPLFILMQSFFIFNYVYHTSMALCGNGSIAGRRVINEIIVRRRMLGGVGGSVACCSDGNEDFEEGVDASSSRARGTQDIRALFNQGIYPQLDSVASQLRLPRSSDRPHREAARSPQETPSCLISLGDTRHGNASAVQNEESVPNALSPVPASAEILYSSPRSPMPDKDVICSQAVGASPLSSSLTAACANPKPSPSRADSHKHSSPRRKGSSRPLPDDVSGVEVMKATPSEATSSSEAAKWAPHQTQVWTFDLNANNERRNDDDAPDLHRMRASRTSATRLPFEMNLSQEHVDDRQGALEQFDGCKMVGVVPRSLYSVGSPMRRRGADQRQEVSDQTSMGGSRSRPNVKSAIRRSLTGNETYSLDRRMVGPNTYAQGSYCSDHSFELLIEEETEEGEVGEGGAQEQIVIRSSQEMYSVPNRETASRCSPARVRGGLSARNIHVHANSGHASVSGLDAVGGKMVTGVCSDRQPKSHNISHKQSTSPSLLVIDL